MLTLLLLQIRVVSFLCFVLVQLEKVIGKLKTGKYGNKILEQIINYSDFKLTDEQASDGRAAKRSKTKNLVLIETSEDEA